MLWFKQMGVKRVLIYNGEVHVFDISGKEDSASTVLAPEYTFGAVKVSAISVLKSNNNLVEVGVMSNEKFTRFSTKMQHGRVLMSLMQQGKTVGYFNREGKVDDLGFLQTVLIYPEQEDLIGKLKNIGIY